MQNIFVNCSYTQCYSCCSVHKSLVIFPVNERTGAFECEECLEVCYCDFDNKNIRINLTEFVSYLSRSKSKSSILLSLLEYYEVDYSNYTLNEIYTNLIENRQNQQCCILYNLRPSIFTF